MTRISDTQRAILIQASQRADHLAVPPGRLPAAARQSVLRSLLAKDLLEEIPAPPHVNDPAWRQDDTGAQPALRITPAGLAAISWEAPCRSTGAALFPVAPQGGSQAVCLPPPSSTAAPLPEAPQAPPEPQPGPSGRRAALRTAAMAVTAAWDAPDREGLEEAVVALRATLAAAPAAPRRAGASRQPRTGTKQETVLALLRRDEGTTIAQIVDATSWQPHTVRGFLAGLKRRGITVEVLDRIRQVGPNQQGAKGSYSIYRIVAGAAAASVEAG